MRVWYEAMPAGIGSPVASPTGKRRGHEMEERYAEPLKSASVSRSSAHWRYWGWLESWTLLRSYLAVETRQQAPCKKKTHRENAPELLVHL